MPVPAQGNVLTPAGFLVLSAQGLVSLSWSQTPLATIYYINRSTDNVSFTNIGNTTLTQYNDSTAVVNTLYYYKVQAATALASSASTVSQVGQSLKPGQSCVSNLVLEAQQRCDKINTENITDQEWISMTSQSYKELYDILIQKFGNDYFIAPPYSYTTTGVIDPTYQAQVFPLPNDFYKLMRVEVALNPSDPNSWVTLKKFESIQANLWNFPNVYTFYGITNLRYRLWGSNLQIVPIAASGQTIRIWYSPRPSQLIAETDVVDGVSGWEEYVITDVCIKALTKEESDISVYASQKMALLKRIEEAAANRDIGLPETVSDVRRMNFAWGDPSDGMGGSGMW